MKMIFIKLRPKKSISFELFWRKKVYFLLMFWIIAIISAIGMPSKGKIHKWRVPLRRVNLREHLEKIVKKIEEWIMIQGGEFKSIVVEKFLSQKTLIWSNFLNFLTFLRRKTLIWNSCKTNRSSFHTKSIRKVNGGVLVERAHYYTILVEGVRTIREGVLIEEGALTEVHRGKRYVVRVGKNP